MKPNLFLSSSFFVFLLTIGSNYFSHFKPSETLIHNYVAVVDSENYQLTNEVDQAKWFLINEAVMAIKPESLAKSFLLEAINKFNLK